MTALLGGVAVAAVFYVGLGMRYDPPRTQPRPVPREEVAGDILGAFAGKGLSRHTERECIFRDLSDAGQVANHRKAPFVPRGMGMNFAGDPFFTDGEIHIITLAD